ncbi:hypothetical protein DMH15_20090 [Streptomyces sp. WAC 06725]|nr:hypothetical protein DMH15_20090 [Streptomyces sp. WAC 06725]
MPLSMYSAQGGLRQGPGRAAQSLAEARTCGNGRHAQHAPRRGRTRGRTPQGGPGSELTPCIP